MRGPRPRSLVTSARMFFVLDIIRKLGRHGLPVVACDTFAQAPGIHSAHVEERRITASPRYATSRFVDQLEELVRARRIDLLLPGFEDAFYIARHRERFERITHLFTADFETLRRLHDKARFVELAGGLGLEVPRSLVATSRAELAAATRELGSFVARPVYSRGGLDLYTNVGPRSGELAEADCHPLRRSPWLVQAFVDGIDLCTLSVCHHGRIAAHAAYVVPRTFDHVGGIAFESVEAPATLSVARRVVEATGYHGVIAFDFKMAGDRPVLLECNPRPTAGVTVMPDEMFIQALLGRPDGPPAVAPAGQRRKLTLALLRDMVVNPRELLPDLLALARGGRELYLQWGDLLPGLYQFLSYLQVVSYRRSPSATQRKRSDLMAAFFFDLQWDGEPIA